MLLFKLDQMKTLDEIKQAIHDYNMDQDKEAVMFMSAQIVKEEEVEDGTLREMKLEFALIGKNDLIIRSLKQVIKQNDGVGGVFKQALDSDNTLELMLKLKALADALGDLDDSEDSEESEPQKSND
jgi:hypothetical protein